MTVIELGEFNNVPGDPEPERGGRAEFDPRTRRRVVYAAVLLACALLIGGSARPGEPLVHELWSTPLTDQDSMSIRRDGVFVFRSAGTTGVELTAYETATGKARWTRASTGNVNWMYQGEQAGLVLIPGDEKYANLEFGDGGQGQIAYGGTTTAIDSRTGRQLWRAPGEAQAVASTSVLLGERDSAGNYVSVWLADARTGAEIWRRPVAGALHLIVRNEGPAPILIVLADKSGNTTVLRYADGSVLKEKTLPWAEPKPEEGRDTYLSVVEDLVLVSRNDPQKAVVTAYRTGSLERLWEIRMSPYAYLAECGPVLCYVDGVSLYGLDPRTGAERWKRAGDSGGAVLVGDRLLASDGAEPPAHFLVDPATGEKVGAGGVGYPMRYEAFDGAILLLHRFYGDGPMWDAVDYLDMATGEVTRVGRLAGAADVQQGWRCDSVERYLACQRDGRLIVTAVG
jgi:outer membrane protein assembly factor BamB